MESSKIIELTVGSDLVHIIGDNVVIFATRAMADWTLREYSRRPIHFQGIKYYLKGKTPASAPHVFRYELAPWTGEFGRESTQEIVYDELYVWERDEAFKLNRRQERVSSALLPLFPFVGFCWSGIKERIFSPLGFEPVATTSASILVAFSFFVLECVFVLSFQMGFLALVLSSSRWLPVDWVLLVVLPVDCAVRYDHIIRGDEFPEGFLEWALRRK